MNPAGRHMMIGFDGKEMSSELEKFIKKIFPAGVILFGRNFESFEQLRKLTRDLKSVLGEDVIVGVDQEGGRVARLSGPHFTKFPPMMELGAKNDAAEAVRNAGATLARELKSAGINLDFAPVLDVLTNDQNKVIGDRAFSSDPQIVAELGCALIGAMQEEGVAACGKHFPGHGATFEDSHLELPMLDHDRARLDECELVPFRAAIECGVASMMTAHLLMPNFDPEYPAAISRALTHDMLREELDFRGVIFTDDLIMKGITCRFGVGEAAALALQAGADIAVICHNNEDIFSAAKSIEKLISEEKILPSVLESSLKRINQLKHSFCK